MPALPDVPQVIRLTFTQRVSNDTDVVNRIFVHYSGTAPTNGTLVNWLNTMSANWLSNVSPLQTAFTTLTSIEAVDLTTPTSAIAVNTTAHVGTRAGAGIAGGQSVLFNYLVQRRYRGGKPRTYLAAGDAADILDAQSWTPAFVTACQNGWTAFTGALSTSPPSGSTITGLVNVSYYKGFTTVTGTTGRVKNVSTPRTTPLVDVINGFTTDPKFGTQRRRSR